MNKNYIFIGGFILMVLAQLYAPASMIFEKEKIIKQGTSYKFRTAPIDPNDPFRGKFIRLDYRNTEFKGANDLDFDYNEKGYISIGVDENGWAKITAISKEVPSADTDYISAKIRQSIRTKTVEFPFDRFYMEESKAYEAEVIARNVQRDTAQTSYALVHILNGKYVLKDVLINDVSIQQLVEERFEVGKE